MHENEVNHDDPDDPANHDNSANQDDSANHADNSLDFYYAN